MPRYDYRCRICDTAFEVTRPMARAADPAACPSGHTDTVKLLSQVAIVGRATPDSSAGRAASAASASSSPPAGGCCGGGACVCSRP